MSTTDSSSETMQAQAPPAAALKDAPAAAAKLELLDDDEIVQLSLKPSLWYIPIVASRVVLILAGFAVLVGLFAAGDVRAYLPAIALIAALLRVAVASLQWASRLYVLTNRRVMRFSGIFRVRVVECPLVRIGQVQLIAATYQRVLRLGSIRMGAPSATEPVVWSHISRPAEVHDLLLRAIRKAKNGPTS